MIGSLPGRLAIDVGGDRVPCPSSTRLGVDLVDVGDVQARLARSIAIEQVFTSGELAYCHAQRRPWPHLAARFAAKEATLKALGTGLAGAMTWRDVEVTRDEAGKPGLVVRGAVADAMARQGLVAPVVSLSHTRTHAIAVVLLFPRDEVSLPG